MHSPVDNIQFDVFNRHYTCAILQPGIMIAVSPEPEGCCWNVLTAFAVGKLLSQSVASESVQPFICMEAAKHAVQEGGQHIQRPHTSWKADINGVIVDVPQFSPYDVPGTDSGSKYRVLAKTNRGLISRKTSHLSTNGARIRVVSIKKGFTVEKINQKIVPTHNYKWGSVQPSHFACNFIGAPMLHAGIASGLLELMRLEGVEG